MRQVTVHVINPVALSLAELYGSANTVTGQWHDGMLARIMRCGCRDEGAEQIWLLLDGPVDECWVESMNTLLDDSRVLTLVSGERLAMPPQVLPGTQWFYVCKRVKECCLSQDVAAYGRC